MIRFAEAEKTVKKEKKKGIRKIARYTCDYISPCSTNTRVIIARSSAETKTCKRISYENACFVFDGVYNIGLRRILGHDFRSYTFDIIVSTDYRRTRNLAYVCLDRLDAGNMFLIISILFPREVISKQTITYCGSSTRKRYKLYNSYDGGRNATF